MELYPAWLKNSKVYEEMNGDDEEDISQHVKYLCEPTINDTNDVAQIVGAIQYWDVHEIPSNIVLYFATHLICPDEFNFTIEFEWLDLFTKLHSLYNDDFSDYQDKFSDNYPIMVKYIEMNYTYYDKFKFCENYTNNINMCHKFCTKYKSCARLDVIKAFMTCYWPARYGYWPARYGYSNYSAARIFHLIKIAAYNGKMDCLQYIWGVLMDPIQPIDDQKPNCFNHVYEWCIIGKQIDSLKCARSVGYGNWSHMDLVKCATICGHLDILTYVCLDCPYISDIYVRLLYTAVCCGHYSCLKFLHEQKNCAITISIVGFVLNSSLLCGGAAAHGQLQCLKYLHENGYPCGSSSCYLAARYGHIECLTYLHENGCPWDMLSCYIAAYYRHLKCLIYLHKNNCPWDDQSYISAIYHGNYKEYSGYLGEQRSEDPDNCLDPNVEFIKYLHKNGWCSWNKKSCYLKSCNECKYIYRLQNYVWF